MLGQNIGRVGLPDMSAGGRPSLTLDFVSIPVLNEKITFSRASGATWFSPDGVLEGVDFSTSSVAIGTGSKTFTLAATAGANRYWAVGDLVRVSQQSNSANFMEGTVTSYTASTQVLVIDVTSTGGSGTIASWRVSSHMPRFDYNPSTLAAQGLLIEESRTNNIYPSNFSSIGTVAGNNAWYELLATLDTTINAASAPDGTTTAALLAINAPATFNAVFYRTASTTAGTYAYSVFCKANSTDTNARLLLAGDVSVNNNVRADFILSGSGVAGTAVAVGTAVSAATPTIQSVGNGWYRCTIYVTLTAPTNITALIYPGAANAQTTASQTLVWGAQLEAGAFPTSYIPTTTTALTRAADVASVNTLSPWYNASAGTVFSEWSILGVRSTNSQRIWSLSDGTNSQYIAVRVDSAAQVRGDQAGGSTIPITVLAVATANTVYKTGVAFEALNSATCLGGGTVNSNATFAFPTGINKLALGNLGTGSFELSGHLRRIVYYPRRLSNAELQSITS